MCGTILWESKRTKNWSYDWLAKVRNDQRAAKAEISLIVSSALPEGLETFDVIDNVWVAAPRFSIPLADVLRQWLIDVAASRIHFANQREHIRRFELSADNTCSLASRWLVSAPSDKGGTRVRPLAFVSEMIQLSAGTSTGVDKSILFLPREITQPRIPPRVANAPPAKSSRRH